MIPSNWIQPIYNLSLENLKMDKYILWSSEVKFHAPLKGANSWNVKIVILNVYLQP